MIYDIYYKLLIGAKPLRINFGKIDQFIRIYDGNRYLTLFDSAKYGVIYNGIRYLIVVKSAITYVFSHYYAKKKVDYYYSLSIEKKMKLYNVIIHIKLVLSKDQNHNDCHISLEKCSPQLAKKMNKIS